jgi:hypothetical protein
MELGPKRIKTDRDYGREVRILWIYNQAISEEFPELFKAFWDVYETWYHHEDRVKLGLSTFLFDKSLPLEEQHWQRERFGNYLYGSFISVYLSWESLESLKSSLQSKKDSTVDAVQSKLSLINRINGVVRYLLTALDALSCCIYIAEGKIPSGLQQAQAEPKYLKKLTVKWVGQELGPSGAYGALASLLTRTEFAYLSEYRNLLTHRPFPQFYQDSRGLYHFPDDLAKLDSITQRNKAYMQVDIAEYLTSAFKVIIEEFQALLPELSARYRKQI